MPASKVLPSIPTRARQTYLAFAYVVRSYDVVHHRSSRCACRGISTSTRRGETYRRSDFNNLPYTGAYEPNENTTGPLKDASRTPHITPRILKAHLDQFVVGQERAKKTLATAVYNHYQRIQELQRRDDEEEERAAQEERKRMASHPRHPVEGRVYELKQGIAVPSLTKDWPSHEDEFPGQQTTINLPGPQWRSSQDSSQRAAGDPLLDDSPLMIEKSNILLLGPSGVGKTLMAKTMARVLEVPFSMSDCTPFTQAGYIGEDAEVCVQRLLAAANYDVARAERGIICLDEIDKIATAKVSHGKDVSGEGVQQSLLKIIEGTTLQIQAKPERGVNGNATSGRSSTPASGSGMGQTPSGGGGKGEVFNVRTDNILFICAGAFNGLHKSILDRLSKGSIGFGAPVRAAPGSESTSNIHETIIEGEDELFEKHLPYYSPPSTRNSDASLSNAEPRKFNTLDLVEPQDLQKFGLIPELVGRIPISCALSSLDIESLVQVLTEPRNSLLAQYTQLFAFSSMELRITSPALRTIATTASKMGTGARGLRTVLERLLAETMFETPGSTVKYVLITEGVAERRCAAYCFEKHEGAEFTAISAREEEEWEERKRRERGEEEHNFDRRARVNTEGGAARTFEEYREKATAAGFN